MPLIAEAALEWPFDPTDPPDGADPDLWVQAKALTVDYLWAVTGRQFGVRSAVWRPQALLEKDEWCRAAASLAMFLPVVWAFDSPCDAWQAVRGKVVRIPGPVASVTSVDIAGAPLLGTAWRADGDYLVRTDGDDWPATQNLLSDPGDPDTWAITYKRGTPVPPAGQIGAALLAREWLKQLSGDANCKVPYNATSASRGSVSVQRDVTKALKTTGIEVLDRWIASVNPEGHKQPPQVWSPDLSRAGRPYAGSY